MFSNIILNNKSFWNLGGGLKQTKHFNVNDHYDINIYFQVPKKWYKRQILRKLHTYFKLSARYDI